MKAAATIMVLLAVGATLGACGSQGIQVASDSPYHRGAVLFRDHCSGCHTLSVVGAEGSATSIANRVRTNGPNFNIRKENVEQVLYAIRNGGYTADVYSSGKSEEIIGRWLKTHPTEAKIAHRHQGPLSDGRWAERPRPVAPAPHGARRVAAAPRCRAASTSIRCTPGMR